MKKIIYCRNAEKIRNEAAGDKQDKSLERHIAECAECGKLQRASDWMQKFSAATAPPQNLPAPGLLLFKARLIEKQSAAIRAVQPIVRAQIASVLIFVLGTVWVLLKSRMQIGSLLKETFLSLSSVATLLVLGVSSAVLICLVFAYFLRETKEFKK